MNAAYAVLLVSLPLRTSILGAYCLSLSFSQSKDRLISTLMEPSEATLEDLPRYLCSVCFQHTT